MNGESLRENFIKVYRENDAPVYVFKAAHGFSMTRETEINRCMLGMGIAPDTYMGVRLCEKDMFYVRYADSEMQYECHRSKLAEYNDSERAKPVFRSLAKLVMNKPVSGAQIYFCCECEDFSEYTAVLVYGFSTLLGIDASEERLLTFLYPEKYSYTKNARALITLSSAENRCEMIEESGIILFSLPMKGCKIIICKLDEKSLKPIDYNKIIQNIETESLTQEEILAFKDTEEYEKLNFAINERKRFKELKEALENGRFADFSHIIKRSSLEYLLLTKKNGRNLKMLFDIAYESAIICGIYEGCGIYAFVEEDRVDKFIKSVGIAYENKIGKKPFFYVCASSETKKV